MIPIRIDGIKSLPDVRGSLQTIKDEWDKAPFLNSNFSFFSIVFNGAVANYKYTHNLGFTPTDVLQTSLTGSGLLVWNYSLFSMTQLDITTTGPCVVRAFIGRF